LKPEYRKNLGGLFDKFDLSQSFKRKIQSNTLLALANVTK